MARADVSTVTIYGRTYSSIANSALLHTMSTPAINRSLTTIRTELEFLKDSDVITESLYLKLSNALPQKHNPSMSPWGLDKIETASNKLTSSHDAEKLSMELSRTSINSLQTTPHTYRPPQGPPAVGHCIALYDYNPTEPGDLSLSKDDKIRVTEHLSKDWWKGSTKQSPTTVGVFPSNYVRVIPVQEFDADLDFKLVVRPTPPVQHNNSEPNYLQPQASSGQNYGPLFPTQDQLYSSQYSQQYPQPPKLYGGYAPVPQPLVNYYSPPVQQPQQVEPAAKPQSLLLKIGGKFGNAAIFGAGATVGSDIVNAIF